MKFFFVVLLSLTYLSCGPKLNDENKVLKDEVMAIHDDVMPKMSDIHRNKKMLRKALKVVEGEENKKVLSLHIKKLEEADEAMMKWMGEYKIPESDNEAKEYLLRQKKEISSVRDQMLKAIEKSGEIIKRYEGIK